MERWKRFCVAAAYLVVGALFNLVLQVWVDQVPTDYPPDFVLWDLGFVIFPYDLPKWVPDIMVGTVIVVAILRICFVPLPDGRNWLEVWIRLLFVWGTLYFLRGFTVGITRFPRLTPGGPLPTADGLFAGLWRILTGGAGSESDFMFSGHTAAMTIFGLFMSYYTYHHLFSKLYWVFIACGYWSVLAARIHYSADMVVAILVSVLVFHLFHAIADPDWLSGWRSTMVIHVPPAEYRLPLRLIDGDGKEWTVYQRESSVLGLKGTADGEDDPVYFTHMRTGRFSSQEKRRLYHWLVKLLGGS